MLIHTPQRKSSLFITRCKREGGCLFVSAGKRYDCGDVPILHGSHECCLFITRCKRDGWITATKVSPQLGGWGDWRLHAHWRFRIGGFKFQFQLKYQYKLKRGVIKMAGARAARGRRPAVVVGATPASRRRVGSLRAVVVEVAVDVRGAARLHESRDVE